MLGLTTAAIGLLIAADVGYFIKAAVYVIGPMLLSKVHPLKKSKLYGICTTRDVDFMLNHVNNARYVRQMDFGRLNQLVRSRILTPRYSGLVGGQVLLAATTIRYRRSVYLFMPYRLESQIVHWDDKSIYYRQNFISLHDNFLRVTAYTKIATVGATPAELIERSACEKVTPPEPSEDLLEWIGYLQSSSDLLKQQR